jgi:5-methylcytosine-specific restriction endonuclease McrA
VPFSDINDFIKKIKDYEWIDGTKLMNEIKLVLEDNIKKLPERKEKKPKTKKKHITSTIKKLVWNTNIGEEIGKSKCLCCKSTDITQLSFNCGHIIAESNGGDTIVSNLRPICQNCNSSMGTKNMNDFMETLK